MVPINYAETGKKISTKVDLINEIIISSVKSRFVIEKSIGKFVSVAFSLLEKELKDLVVNGRYISDETQKKLQEELIKIDISKDLDQIFNDETIIDNACKSISLNFLMKAKMHIANLINKDNQEIKKYFDTNIFDAFGSIWNTINFNNEYNKTFYLDKQLPNKELSYDPFTLYNCTAKGIISAIQMIGGWAASKAEEECLNSLQNATINRISISKKDFYERINIIRLHQLYIKN